MPRLLLAPLSDRRRYADDERPIRRAKLQRNVERDKRNAEALAAAAVGAVLLAKATNPDVDAFVIQVQEGSPGAFNLWGPATALAMKKREYAYDIGSSSDRDPINQGTLVNSPRWDVALERIREDHKPFFQLILTWLPDVNRLSQRQALEALAAYIRIRRRVSGPRVIGNVAFRFGRRASCRQGFRGGAEPPRRGPRVLTAISFLFMGQASSG